MKIYRAIVTEYNGRIWQTEDSDEIAAQTWLFRTILRVTPSDERIARTLPETKVQFFSYETEPELKR